MSNSSTNMSKKEEKEGGKSDEFLSRQKAHVACVRCTSTTLGVHRCDITPTIITVSSTSCFHSFYRLYQYVGSKD